MRSRFLIPRDAEVIVTFNGTTFHLEEKRCYRRIVAALLRRQPENKLAILVPDAAEIPIPGKRAITGRDCVFMLQTTFKNGLNDALSRIKAHGGVLGIASALIVSSAEVKAYIFNHNSLPIEQESDTAERLWKRFAS